MGGWRLAFSLEQLRREVLAISPQTVTYDIDDTPQLDSDHDANEAGVVCALDIMQGHGLDLGAVAEQIRQRRNPDLKYVIFNRRIASAASNPPWSWRDYTGENPHTDHVHASVGIGSDGHSQPPYDDETPWGIAGEEPMAEWGEEGHSSAEIWRVEALMSGSEKVRGGIVKGEPVWLVTAIKELQAAVAALSTGGIDYAALAKAVNDDAAARLAE